MKKFGKKIKKNHKFKTPRPKQKVKRHVIEDEEIKKLLENYENISKCESFDDFPLSNLTRRGLKDCKFKTPTEIQKEAIGPALQGKDVLGAAKTGSGK
jgi:ATP-dependent RNA helicase DDX10/DBP4